MSFTYTYDGDVPTVFVSLQKDGATWVPKHGDTITTDEPVAHPLLRLTAQTTDEVPDVPVVPELAEVSVPEKHDEPSSVPVKPDNDKPVTADTEGAD